MWVKLSLKFMFQKTVDDLIRNLEGFIPHERLRGVYSFFDISVVFHFSPIPLEFKYVCDPPAALNNGGILTDYQSILMEMRTQMNTVLHFLDAHIELLQEFAKDQPVLNSDKGYDAVFVFETHPIKPGEQ